MPSIVFSSRLSTVVRILNGLIKLFGWFLIVRAAVCGCVLFCLTHVNSFPVTLVYVSAQPSHPFHMVWLVCFMFWWVLGECLDLVVEVWFVLFLRSLDLVMN